MAKRQASAKRPTTAFDRTRPYPLADAIKLVKANASAKFDETVEMSMNLGIDPRHADQMVRGADLSAERHRQDAARRRVRARRQGRGGAGRRGRRGRRRGPGREGPGRRDRLRPLHRHPGHDGAGRAAGQDPRPARADAEPAARHGDDGRGGRGAAPPRAARWSSAPRRRASSMPASARRASRTTSCSRMPARWSTRSQKAKPTGAKGTYVQKVALSSTMGPGVRVDVTSLGAG